MLLAVEALNPAQFNGQALNCPTTAPSCSSNSLPHDHTVQHTCSVLLTPPAPKQPAERNIQTAFGPLASNKPAHFLQLQQPTIAAAAATKDPQRQFTLSACTERCVYTPRQQPYHFHFYCCYYHWVFLSLNRLDNPTGEDLLLQMIQAQPPAAAAVTTAGVTTPSSPA